jgi:hypothetical protein
MFNSSTASGLVICVVRQPRMSVGTLRL